MEFNSGFTVIEFLLFVILGLVCVWLATIEWRLMRMTRTLRVLFSGRTGSDLEQVLRDYLKRMDRSDQAVSSLGVRFEQNLAALGTRLEQRLAGLASRTTQLEEKAPLTVQHIGIVRFNPFADKGGDQSFAVALLDDHANGVVLNGLHSRNDTRVYAKPIVGGTSSYTLTGEEKEAISRAMGNRQVQKA
jgi:hypothetical protein